jgi:hypothetical protein
MLCYEAEKTEASDKKRKVNHEAYEVFYDQSTTKLRRHLKKCHQDIRHEIKTKKAKHISLNMKSFMKDMGVSRSKFYRFMIMTYQPMSLVESPYFREWMESLSLNYKHMSRNGVKETLSLLAGAMKEQLRSLIAGKYVSLTGDKWSSINHQGYLGLTCHFIDADWNLQRSDKLIIFTIRAFLMIDALVLLYLVRQPTRQEALQTNWYKTFSRSSMSMR